MKDKRFMEACDRLNIRDSRREELLGEIFLRIEAEEREGKYMKDSNRRRRQGKLWPKLAPVLAVVLILGAILLVPSVGEAGSAGCSTGASIWERCPRNGRVCRT